MRPRSARRRKKFRKSLNKNDNDYHDKITDSLVNFETVKYFAAEGWEERRFGDAVAKYQAQSVNVQASLSALNISQQVLMQGCLGLALSLAVVSIRGRMDCEAANEEDGTDDECKGMVPGDFVSVTVYILQLFTPLNFLGTVYNALVMAFVDLGNLSELLAEERDVEDLPGAVTIPSTDDYVRGRPAGEDTVVEFKDVHFKYPTQPASRGLKGFNLKMKRGTVTAIVGPTGAGKTTISRLLLRFYDCVGGSVAVNGVDIKAATQTSLRSLVGVVPQDTPLFNDTIRYNIAYGRRNATFEEVRRGAALWREAQGAEGGRCIENSYSGGRTLPTHGNDSPPPLVAAVHFSNINNTLVAARKGGEGGQDPGLYQPAGPGLGYHGRRARPQAVRRREAEGGHRALPPQGPR